MKDSGIEWVGVIPDEWNIRKSKYLMKKSKDICPHYGNEPILSLTMDGVIIRDLDNPVGKMPLSFDGYQRIKKGNLLLCLFDIDVTPRCVGLINNDGLTSPAYSHYSLSPNADAKYYYYFLLYLDNKKELVHLSKNLRYSISEDEFGNFLFPLPKLRSQKQIGDWLDFRCHKIQDIISFETRIIEKLKEYRQSVITEVVTKGLHDVPMKDSGIEWIGEIPEHWKILAFRFILSERNEKNIPIKTDNRLSLSIDKGVTLYAEKTTNLDRFKDDVSGYKLTHEGDLVLNSMNMIVGAVGFTKYYGCVSPAYYTYYDNELDHCTAKYCDYIFKSKTIRKVLYSLGKGILSIDRGDDKINTCRLKVSREDLRSLKLPIPGTEEQREIISYLDKKCAAIDNLIAKKEIVLNKLEEYKKSLIYEYVTGKKEIPLEYSLD